MKKLMPILLALAVVFSLASCASTRSADGPNIRITSIVENKMMPIPQPAIAYVETDVQIPTADRVIPATICAPAAEGVYPAVVMLHGTGSNRNEAGDGYAIAAPILAEKYGIVTIRIDFPGNGDSTAPYTDYDFKSAVADAVAAANYVGMLDYVDADKIGVMGWSQGGTDALLAAARTDRFSSVVTWAGAPDLAASGLLTKALYAEATKNGFFVMEFEWRSPLNVSLQWCKDVLTTDVLKEFAISYDGPVLAIAGTEDTVVDPKYAAMIAAVSPNPKSAALFIPGMDHTFNVFAEADQSTLKVAIDATGEYFSNTLK